MNESSVPDRSSTEHTPSSAGATSPEFDPPHVDAPAVASSSPSPPHADAGSDPSATDPSATGSDDAATDDATIDLDAIERDLTDVQTALDRLNDGSYWTDEVTGEPIADDILASHPTARTVSPTLN